MSVWLSLMMILIISVLLTVGIMFAAASTRIEKWEDARVTVGIAFLAIFMAVAFAGGTITGMLNDQTIDLYDFIAKQNSYVIEIIQLGQD